MTKKASLLLTISLLFSVALSAQKPGNWSVGMVFQPCLYWKHNKSDWNNRPASYPEQPRKFNGWAAGISVNRYINQIFSIGGELSYSQQHQDFKATNTVSNDKIIYNVNVVNELDYVKMPLFICAKYEIGYESGLYLKMRCGPQLSINTHYFSEYRSYQWDAPSQKIDYSTINYSIKLEPSHVHEDFWESNGTYIITDFDTPYLYRRIDLGIVGGIALEKQIGDRYTLSLGTRYEFGITNIESSKDKVSYVTFVGTTGPTGETLPRPATHNRRLVLDLGISRIID